MYNASCLCVSLPETHCTTYTIAVSTAALENISHATKEIEGGSRHSVRARLQSFLDASSPPTVFNSTLTATQTTLASSRRNLDSYQPINASSSSSASLALVSVFLLLPGMLIFPLGRAPRCARLRGQLQARGEFPTLCMCLRKQVMHQPKKHQTGMDSRHSRTHTSHFA